MQELLLISTFLGLPFIGFPARGACLLTMAITGFAMWNHILAACNYLGQQTITGTLCIVYCVHFVPSLLALVGSALASAAVRGKRIIASMHTWAVNILRRSAACSLNDIGDVAVSVLKVSKQFVGGNSETVMYLPYNLTLFMCDCLRCILALVRHARVLSKPR